MAVRDTLNKVENLVAGASHLPLTGKALIDEDELSALIDELRNALPQELDRAEQIIRDRESMIQSAQQQAEKIIKDAQRQAERLVDENDIVLKARKNAQRRQLPLKPINKVTLSWKMRVNRRGTFKKKSINMPIKFLIN